MVEVDTVVACYIVPRTRRRTPRPCAGEEGWRIGTDICTAPYWLEARDDDRDMDRIQEPRLGHVPPG